METYSCVPALHHLNKWESNPIRPVHIVAVLLATVSFLPSLCPMETYSCVPALHHLNKWESNPIRPVHIVAVLLATVNVPIR